jgi:geranylgeranyl reductase family protein
MDRYDVVVVGGGPSGLVAARHASLAGARTLLVETRAESRDPIPCAGLVSPRTLALLGASRATVLREVRAVTLHTPGGETATLRSEKVKALVLDRTGLETELRRLAASAGVNVLLGTRAVETRPGAVRLATAGGEQTVKVGVVIAADGPGGRAAQSFSLSGAVHLLTALQAVVEGEAVAADGVEVFLGRRVAPGFFAWVVPAEEGRLRVGLAAPIGTELPPLLRNLLARTPGRLVSDVTGLIPIGAAPTTSGDGIVVVGDAAGQVKPLSGGGIYPGSLCARIAGEIAAQAALSGDTSARALAAYDRRWQAEMGEELHLGLAAHDALSLLSDDEIDSAVATLAAAPDLRDLLAAEGDIDYPSRLLPRLLERRDLEPALLSLAAALSGALPLRAPSPYNSPA